jgi:hypothetical protein
MGRHLNPGLAASPSATGACHVEGAYAIDLRAPAERGHGTNQQQPVSLVRGLKLVRSRARDKPPSIREATVGHGRALLIYLRHRGALNIDEFRRTNSRNS